MPLFKLILLFSLIFTFVFRGHSQTQIIENVKSTRIFLNKKENSFLLFDDSTFYYKYKIPKGKWEKHPYIFQGECSFVEFQNEFIPISLDNGEIYFVYRGVGEVYGLKNDTLKRIDKSFRHENQFNGNLFTHKNKIYCFGGYGLFTTKNFISYFNIKLKEWMVNDIPLKYETPASRQRAYSQKIGDNFYVLSGHWSNTIEKKVFSDVWLYSIEKNRWHRLGKLNPNGINLEHLGWFDTEQAASKLLRIANNIYYVDFEKNKVTTFSSVDYHVIHHPLFDATEKYICLIVQKSQFNKNAVVYERKELLARPVKTVDLYLIDDSNKTSFSWLYLLSILPVSILLLVITWYRRKNKKSTATISKNKGSYYLNGHLLSEEFSVIDTEVLMHFLLAEENTLEIADINRILEYDNATIDAVKKRREQSIKNIREKLALYSNIQAENVFISSQHPHDRRIKRLKLNPILLQKTTK